MLLKYTTTEFDYHHCPTNRDNYLVPRAAAARVSRVHTKHAPDQILMTLTLALLSRSEKTHSNPDNDNVLCKIKHNGGHTKDKNMLKRWHN